MSKKKFRAAALRWGSAVLPPEGRPVLVLRPDGHPVLKPAVDQQTDDAQKPDEKMSRVDTRGAWAASVYQSPVWSLGHVLAWIAFRDPEWICRFESGWSAAGKFMKSRHRLALYEMYGIRSGKKGRLVVVAQPARVLLAALQNGDLLAIRGAAEIPSLDWVDKDVQDLTDDLHFRKAEVLKWRPAENAEGATTPDPVAVPQSAAVMLEAIEQKNAGLAATQEQRSDMSLEASHVSGGDAIATPTVAPGALKDDGATDLLKNGATAVSPRRQGRNPGDGAIDDSAELKEMLDLIKSGKAKNPTAAGKLVVKPKSAAVNAYRRLAGKFITIHGPDHRAEESWVDTCRRIADKMQTK